MKYKFYFGNVEFHIDCPFEVDWKKTDTNFFTPVIPTKKLIEVYVYTHHEFHKKSGNPIYSSPVMDVFICNDQEIRYFYNTNSRKRFLLASALYEHNKIEIHLDPLWNNNDLSLLMMIFTEKILLKQEGLILHCSYMETTKGALLFTAPSGTGKTTQSNLWNRIYHTKVINGDRCLIQKNKASFFANGFFLHGTAPECENISMPIRAIVIVRQSDQDMIEELSDFQKIMLLFSECSINSWNKGAVNKTLDLIESIVKQTKILMLHCTMNTNAAIVLHNYLEETM